MRTVTPESRRQLGCAGCRNQNTETCSNCWPDDFGGTRREECDHKHPDGGSAWTSRTSRTFRCVTYYTCTICGTEIEQDSSD